MPIDITALSRRLFLDRAALPRAVTENPSKILLLRPDDRMGNLLLTTPLAAALRKRFPEAEIHWLIPERFTGLISHNPHGIRILGFEKRRLFTNPVSWGRFLLALRREGYDITLDASHEHARSRTGLMLTQWVNAPVRVGHDRGNAAKSYTHALSPASEDLHDISRKLRLMQPFGKYAWSEDSWIGRLPSGARKKMETWVRKTFDPSRPVFVLWPGGRKADRRWPVDRYVRLLRDSGVNRHGQLCVGWGKGEAARARAIAGEFSGRLSPEANPEELAALFSLVHGYIGNDTGPLHLAAACGIPTFSLHPTRDGKRWGYANSPHRLVWTDGRPIDTPPIVSKLRNWLHLVGARER